ncbi:MAG TPA: flavin reductase family protein [Nakamurella sp.]
MMVDRFAPSVRWHRLDTGEPVLDDGPAWLRARLVDRLPVGDDHLVIGAVENGGTRPVCASPLVYHNGTYHTLNAERARPAVIFANNCIAY